MKVAWAPNALPHVKHAESGESETPDEPKLDHTTHVNEQGEG